MGNCSKWLTQALSFATKREKLATRLESGGSRELGGLLEFQILLKTKLQLNLTFGHPRNTVKNVRTRFILGTS